MTIFNPFPDEVDAPNSDMGLGPSEPEPRDLGARGRERSKDCPRCVGDMGDKGDMGFGEDNGDATITN